ncbi:MAG: hypothetical protein ACOCV2_10510, partial [Persicimonas sp.]
YRLDDGQLSATEEEVWKAASFRDQRTEPIDGRPPESLFGVDVTGYEDDLKRRVATRHSTTVSYRGRNNQVYSKECRVEPDDVKVTTRQVLLSYPNLDFEVGPTRYACRLTGSADVEPHVVAARGIDPNDLDRIWQGRSAYLCNDCAQITPTDAEPSPAACGDCGRTLCASHHWRFPNKAPQSWVDRCASCYREEAQTDPTLGDFPIGGYAATVFSGLIPGLSFFAGGRFAIGTFFSLLAAGTIAAPLVLGWSVQESAPFGIGLGAICLWSLLATLVWANRLRRHRQNLVELEGYTPEWRSQE